MNPRTAREEIAGPAGRIEIALDRARRHAARRRGASAIRIRSTAARWTTRWSQTLARAFVQLGWTARCASTSAASAAREGEWDEGHGEVDDALAVVGVRSARCRGPAAARWPAFRSAPTSPRRPPRGCPRATGRARLVLVGPATAKLQRARGAGRHRWSSTARPTTWCRCRPRSTGRARKRLPVVVLPGVGHFFHGQLTRCVTLVNCTSWPRSDPRSSRLADRKALRCRFANSAIAAWLLAAVAHRRRSPRRRSRPRWPRADYLLLDLTTDQTLAERDADAPVDPASLTKLMTAYLVFNALQGQEADARADAAGVDARLGRAQGRRLADVHRHDDDAQGRRAAASGMIVQCRATTPRWRWPKAWAAASTPSSAMMNRQAQAWGLKNTQFKNVTGLTEAGPPQHARATSR